MAKRLFFETLELNDGIDIDLWSTRLRIDQLSWIEVKSDIFEFISTY